VGNGIDLAGLRPYVPGDDVRYIDWNVTARLDEPWVRDYHEDRDLTAWFLVDLSPSVDFGTAEAERRKRTVLIDFVATMARLLTRRGNRVGAVLYGGSADRTIPVAGGRPQVLRLVRELLADEPLDRAPMTNLSPLLASAGAAIKRRSLIFIVSDFISEPGWEKPLSLLTRRHEVVAVRLHDPTEAALPDAGLLVLQDAETGDQLHVDTGDRAFRERFEAAARRREEGIATAFRHAGVDALPLSTDDDLVRAIVRIAALRRLRRR
jgi:uncharacterized protein (DUF58 family)